MGKPLLLHHERASRSHTFALTAAALLALAPSGARADSPWSASAHGGFDFFHGKNGGTNLGGSGAVLHSIGPIWSGGAELGYADCTLSGFTFGGYPAPTGHSKSLVSASGILRLRAGR